MSWYPCPKCNEPLDSDYEPIDCDFFQTGAVATNATCPKCNWKGQIVFSVEFADYYDDETEEMVSELDLDSQQPQERHLEHIPTLGKTLLTQIKPIHSKTLLVPN